MLKPYKIDMAKYRVKCYGYSLFKVQQKILWWWEDYTDWNGVIYYIDKEKALDKIKGLNRPKLKITYEYPLQ